MSYEVFRAEIVSKLNETMDIQEVESIINKIDIIADRYEVSIKNTDIILSEPIPQAVKYYLAAKSVEHLTKATLDNYYSLLRSFFKTVKKSPDDIVANDIRAFLYKYQQETNARNSTVDNKRIIIHGFFTWCCDEGLIRHNPSIHVNPIKFPDNPREPMDRDELEIMRDACKDKREVALVDFMFSTGCRVSEIAQMKISDVDWDDRIVTIQHGKGDKKRISYLNPKAVVSLRNYLKSRDDDCEYLFVNKRTKTKHHITKKSIEQEIHAIWLRTGLKHKITPHIYRHTSGTLAAQSGMPIEHVQKFLGHSSIKTTMRYVKVFDDDVKASHRKFAS